MTKKQQSIFRTIRKAILAHRRKEHDPSTPITFINDLSAADKTFINTLATELNLTLAWDGFDDKDHNVVSLYFPQLLAPTEGPDGDDGDEQWEDVSDEDQHESNAAVDRVLNRYSQAKVLDEDREGGFDAREAQRLKERMDEWKRSYYKVRHYCVVICIHWESRSTSIFANRTNLIYLMTTDPRSKEWSIDGSRAYNGLCSTITVESPRGAGSMIIITLPVSLV